MRVDCPKCFSQSARYEKSTTDLTLVCLCGYRKLVFTTLLDGMTIEHRTAPSSVKLPRENTHLRITLTTLSTIEPANSKEITDRLVELGQAFTVSDVSSYLTMLRAKGLVEALDSKRGVPGGSTWQLTDRASDLLGI
jgi:hypothetical protein